MKKINKTEKNIKFSLLKKNGKKVDINHKLSMLALMLMTVFIVCCTMNILSNVNYYNESSNNIEEYDNKFENENYIFLSEETARANSAKSSVNNVVNQPDIKKKETETNSSEEYELTIEPPENGWTHEQLSEVTYLCGKPFSLPCKLEDLPNNFEIDKVKSRNEGTELHTYITVNGQDSNFYDARLLLDGKSLGLVHYFENETDKIVFSIDLHPDLYGRDILEINGINQNSSFLEIKQALGETFMQNIDSSCLYSYTVTNSEYPEECIRVMSFGDDEEIGGFCYSLFEVKNKETEKNSSEEHESTTSYEINEWTFEDFISDLEVNDQKITLPYSYEELSEMYEFDNKDNKCSYSEKLGGYSFYYEMDYRTEYKMALISCTFLSQDENINNGKLIRFAVYSDSSGDYEYNFNCGGINNFSQMTKSDVTNILGEPDSKFPFESRYRFENNKEIIIGYDKNRYVNCIEIILGY